MCRSIRTEQLYKGIFHTPKALPPKPAPKPVIIAANVAAIITITLAATSSHLIKCDPKPLI